MKEIFSVRAFVLYLSLLETSNIQMQFLVLGAYRKRPVPLTKKSLFEIKLVRLYYGKNNMYILLWKEHDATQF